MAEQDPIILLINQVVKIAPVGVPLDPDKTQGRELRLLLIQIYNTLKDKIGEIGGTGDLSNYYNRQEIDILLTALKRVGLSMYRLTLTPGQTAYPLPESITVKPDWIDVISPSLGPIAITDLEFTYDATTREISGWHYPTEGEDEDTAIPADATEFMIWYNNGGGSGTGNGNSNGFNATAISSTQVVLTWD